MKLKKLLKDIEGIEIKGPKEIEVSGVCSNSRLVSPGNLFIARKGKEYDGTKFIAEAIMAGASAIVTDLYDPAYKDVPQIVCKDVAKVEAEIAEAYYGNPSEKLYTVGITGTSGKTTVSFLVKHLLENLEGPSGLIGGIEYQIGKTAYPATHTTPDVVRVHKLLKEMVDADMRSAVMEVTSHALDQGRVKGVHFDAAIFTNLSNEHLDYHTGIDDYARAKEKLFYMLKNSKSASKTAIVNADSPWSSEMLKRYGGNVLTYGIKNHADIRAAGITLHQEKMQLTVAFRGINSEVIIPLSGRFNIYNYLAAVGIGLSKGFSLKECVSALENPPKVPGRLERIENTLGIHVFVDHAHKPDALESVLKALLEVKKGRVITVFGCSGDRDPYKRPVMASIAEKYSDQVIVTNDNPRSEDPHVIINAIVSGFIDKRHIVEPDRKKAIGLAIDKADSEDIVLIAGKGHENYQIFAHQTLLFNDGTIAKEFLDRKNG